jgi:hypothetical protein
MLRSSVLVLAFTGLVGSLVACTNAPVEAETTEVSADGLSSPPSLRSRTRLAKVVEVQADGTSRVEYEPDADAAYLGDAPAFEAVPFRAAAGAPLDITVGGDFPSNAQVVVTDADFRVVGVSTTQSALDHEAASISVAAPGSGFVLVRDLRWVRPMQFDVRVAPGL